MRVQNIFSWVIGLAICGCIGAASAQTISKANEPNIAPPEQIADLQNTQDLEIEYMLANYSQPELAKYTIEMYKAAARNAKLTGKELPPKPTREMLADKQKIGEYLRSFYKYSY